MIRPLLPEELDTLCDRITAIDPWKRLGIVGEVMAANLRKDPDRQMLVWAQDGVIHGTVMFRTDSFARLVFNHGFGEALAARHHIAWPCPWQAIPDGGYISSLAVFPEAQGRGLGSALLAAAEEAVRVAGQTRNYLMVSDFNTGARRLYERCGYIPIACQDDCLEPGNREHLMLKQL